MRRFATRGASGGKPRECRARMPIYFWLPLHPPAALRGNDSEEGVSVGEILNLRRGLAQIGAVSSLSPGPDRHGASFDALAMLLADVALGNERAFARLYELTGGRLLAVARGIVGRADIAED